MIKTYYHLTKPGIIYGNAITAAAGFFLASKGHPDFKLLLATLVGLSLIIASACVVNNIFDTDIDARMDRTKNRALVTKTIGKSNAIVYALILGLLGAWILWRFTNPLTLAIAALGHLTYTLLYTPLKRSSVHATLVGAIAGATPPAVGYVAVANKFDLGALLLFLILVAWQMPHFYSIAIRRLDDYKAADVPVLPVRNGVMITKISIVVYVILFLAATILLRVFKFTGDFYLGLMLVLGLAWLWQAYKGFKVSDDKAWAKKMFLFSLIILLVFSLTISINAIIKL